nr:hypothetical protein [Candidatus Sigynarchaeum springense]
MTDVMARACFNCHVYMVINAASVENQAAMAKFDKDHSLHMVQAVGFGDMGRGYSSRTREYLNRQ